MLSTRRRTRMVGGNALMCSTARDGLRSKAVLSNLFDTAGHTRKLSEAMGRNSKLKGGRTKCLGQNGTSYQYFLRVFSTGSFSSTFLYNANYVAFVFLGHVSCT